MPSDVFLSLSLGTWNLEDFPNSPPATVKLHQLIVKPCVDMYQQRDQMEVFHHPLLKKLKFRLRLVAHINMCIYSVQKTSESKGSNCITRSWRSPCGLNDPVNYGHLFAKSITLQATAPQRGPWMAVMAHSKYGTTSATLPSRELTYPTWGKGKSSSKVPSDGMLISKRVVSGCFFWLPPHSYHFLSFLIAFYQCHTTPLPQPYFAYGRNPTPQQSSTI